MSKTQLVWFCVVLLGFGTSVVKGPMFGLLTYLFIFYTQLSWADSLSIGGYDRWSLYAAVILMVTTLYYNRRHRTNKFYNKMPHFKWLILIIVNMLLVTPFAVDSVGNKNAIIDFIKLTTLYYLVISAVDSKKNYLYFIYFQIWGNFHLGWEAYRHGHFESGRLENIGVPGAFGSNHLSNHLLLIFPFLANNGLFGKLSVKLVVMASSAFILKAFLDCNSRGSFLGAIVIGVILILLTPPHKKKKLIFALMIAACILSVYGGERLLNRMKTIQTYEEDGSAMGRVESWKRAIDMIVEYPLGKGGDSFKFLSPHYIPEIVASYDGQNRAIHNTYLMMATNWGVQGLILLLIFLGSTIKELHTIRCRYGSGNDDFYSTESIAIEAALIGFLVAVIFGNRIYAEGLYWFCALATVLSNIQQDEINGISCRTEKKFIISPEKKII